MDNSKVTMSFPEWLEKQYGISWDYWDNNYSGTQQDEMIQEYYDYLDQNQNSAE